MRNVLIIAAVSCLAGCNTMRYATNDDLQESTKLVLDSQDKQSNTITEQLTTVFPEHAEALAGAYTNLQSALNGMKEQADTIDSVKTEVDGLVSTVTDSINNLLLALFGGGAGTAGFLAKGLKKTVVA